MLLRTSRPEYGRHEANAGVALSKAASKHPEPRQPGATLYRYIQFAADGIEVPSPYVLSMFIFIVLKTLLAPSHRENCIIPHGPLHGS